MGDSYLLRMQEMLPTRKKGKHDNWCNFHKTKSSDQQDLDKMKIDASTLVVYGVTE